MKRHKLLFSCPNQCCCHCIAFFLSLCSSSFSDFSGSPLRSDSLLTRTVKIRLIFVSYCYCRYALIFSDKRLHWREKVHEFTGFLQQMRHKISWVEPCGLDLLLLSRRKQIPKIVYQVYQNIPRIISVWLPSN